MKRVIRSSIRAASDTSNNGYMFTPEEVVQLLEQIEELADVPISCSIPAAGTAEIVVGNSKYRITPNVSKDRY